jgi:hypothetical protein
MLYTKHRYQFDYENHDMFGFWIMIWQLLSEKRHFSRLTKSIHSRKRLLVLQGSLHSNCIIARLTIGLLRKRSTMPMSMIHRTYRYSFRGMWKKSLNTRPGLLVEWLTHWTCNPKRVSEWFRSRGQGTYKNLWISCESKEGRSDETKNRGPLYLSVYARASKRSHTGGQ